MRFFNPLRFGTLVYPHTVSAAPRKIIQFYLNCSDKNNDIPLWGDCDFKRNVSLSFSQDISLVGILNRRVYINDETMTPLVDYKVVVCNWIFFKVKKCGAVAEKHWFNQRSYNCLLLGRWDLKGQYAHFSNSVNPCVQISNYITKSEPHSGLLQIQCATTLYCHILVVNLLVM